MKEIIINFKNFLVAFGTSLGSLFKDWTWNKLQSFLIEYYQDCTKKLKDLKGTNWDLALYHLRLGNYNDAIMRFKLVQKAGYKADEANYFLALLYHEKGQIKEVKKYLDLYSQSADQKYQEELKYLRYLNSDESNEVITKVPQSILLLRREKIAYNLGTSSFDEGTIKRFLGIINLLKNQTPNCDRFLELGCHIGFVGKLLRENLPINYLKGKDFGLESIKLSQLLQNSQNHKIYNELELADDFAGLFRERSLYDLVVIPELLDYFSNLSDIFMENLGLLKDYGLLLIAFRQDESPFHYSHSLDSSFNLIIKEKDEDLKASDNSFSFEKDLELFSFNPDYVKSLAEKMGFTLKVSLEISDFTIFLLGKC